MNAARKKKAQFYYHPLAGIAAIAAGILTLIWTVLIATQPVPPAGFYRDTEHLALWQGLSFLLMAAGVGGIYLQHQSIPSQLSKIGFYCAAIGAILAAIGDILSIFYTTNFILVPIFFAPGSLAMLLGFFLTGVAVIQGRLLPAWSGWLLILAPVFGLIIDENSQNAWFGIGFGLVWIVIGLALLRYGQVTTPATI
jgi:hypothetical protein